MTIDTCLLVCTVKGSPTDLYINIRLLLYTITSIFKPYKSTKTFLTLDKKRKETQNLFPEIKGLIWSHTFVQIFKLYNPKPSQLQLHERNMFLHYWQGLLNF